MIITRWWSDVWNYGFFMARWPSGWWLRSWKPARLQNLRGFESHPLLYKLNIRVYGVMVTSYLAMVEFRVRFPVDAYPRDRHSNPMDNVMISKSKARRSKSVNLSRFKHLWCSGNTIVFQTVVDGSSPSRCSTSFRRWKFEPYRTSAGRGLSITGNASEWQKIEIPTAILLFFPPGKIAQLVERFTSVKRSRVRVPL